MSPGRYLGQAVEVSTTVHDDDGIALLEVQIYPTRLQQGADGRWEMEALLERFPGTQVRLGAHVVTFPDGQRGVVTREETLTDLAWTGNGAMAGRRRSELTIEGPAA